MARNTRSTEAPMDYEWTNRPSIKPSWSETPRKRPHDDLKPNLTPFGTPNPSIFGSNQNIPFIFNQNPTHRTSYPPPWAPPASFSPDKAFPNPTPQQELKDVDMSELSPNKAEESKPAENGGRTMAAGALRRVFRSRQKPRDARSPKKGGRDDENDEGDVFGSDEDDDHGGLIPRNMSNHYTLNMAPPPPPPSDLPYVLSGYLQFIFNLSLILLFLYLVIQFILTVQRDVEQRISEYSMDIVQDIAICALQYKTNLCATNAIPAMAQQCANWDTCMNRDPAIVGRAKVGAELIAEVINNFVEPISWKTLAFTLSSLAFFTFFINSLLSLFRARHHPQAHNPQQPFVPNHAQYPPHFGAAPAPAWAHSRSRLVGGDENFETPTRRRRLVGGEAVKVK